MTDPAFIVMHRTPRTIQLMPVQSFIAKHRVQRLSAHHPLNSRVAAAMGVLFQPIRDARGAFTLKELWDLRSGHPALERCNFLAANGQFPNRIIVKP